jgi:uncharacterized membrane protein YbhN (UPF0104 family)
MVGAFLALIGSVLLIEKNPGFFPVLLAFFLFMVITFVVFIQKKTGNKLFNFLVRPLIPSKYKQSFDDSIDSLYEDIPKIRDMAWPFLLELIIWIVAATQVYIIAQVFSINVPYIDFILISIISVVVTGILPISIGGLGIREGAFVILLSTYGVVPQIAFVISLAGFLVKHLIPGAVGLIISFFKSD